jgi:large subunit ribosomal protein L4
MKLSVGAKRTALRQALSLANKAGKLVTIDTFACPEGKTKETIKLLEANKIAKEQRVLLVVSTKDDLVRRATNNVNQVKVVQAMYLNVFDILNADKILVSMKALDIVTEWLKKEAK